MKRLFALRDSRGHLVKTTDNQPMYFDSKDAARKYRSWLSPDKDQYFVTYGIDHKLYKGVYQ
jgi:hypothetical protein